MLHASAERAESGHMAEGDLATAGEENEESTQRKAARINASLPKQLRQIDQV